MADIQQHIENNELALRIAQLIETAHAHVYAAVNTAMVNTYYEIGRMIVDDEQNRQQRADYGKQVLQNVAKQLTKKFGKGFSYSNLRQMRQFYLIYSKESDRQCLSNSECRLSWSHYLKLIIGQMQLYVNYFDREVKLDDENPTIGLLLCADKTDAMVEYTLPKDNNQIFASKYATVLPSKEALKQLLLNK